MNERPEQPPEGRLLADALKRIPKLSQRGAAEKAGMSEGHWRAIVTGSRSVSAGVWMPVKGPAETIARMANVVGVTVAELEAVGREDAALELRLLQRPTEADIDNMTALSPESRAAAQRLREYIDRMVEERNEAKLRTTERVVRAITEEDQAG